LHTLAALPHAPSRMGLCPRGVEDPLLLLIVGDLSAQLFAAEAVLAAQAKLIVDDLVLKAGMAVFDLGGASSTLRSQNLDGLWRNARTVASHNPALYKALALGKLAVHGEPLPDKDFF